MTRILNWFGKIWNRLEYPITVGAGFAMLAIAAMFLSAIVINGKLLTLPALLGFGFALMLSTFFLFRGAVYLTQLRSYKSAYKSLSNNFQETLELCKKWEKNSQDWQDYSKQLREKYFGDVTTIITVNAEHSEVMPQQHAILSNLIDNAVQAPAIKSIVEFSQNVTSENTVFLIRMDHSKARWYLSVTGRSIDLDQAKGIMDGAKKKLNDFASKNSLVKRASKIQN